MSFGRVIPQQQSFRPSPGLNDFPNPVLVLLKQLGEFHVLCEYELLYSGYFITAAMF